MSRSRGITLPSRNTGGVATNTDKNLENNAENGVVAAA